MAGSNKKNAAVVWSKKFLTNMDSAEPFPHQSFQTLTKSQVVTRFSISGNGVSAQCASAGWLQAGTLHPAKKAEELLHSTDKEEHMILWFFFDLPPIYQLPDNAQQIHFPLVEK